MKNLTQGCLTTHSAEMIKASFTNVHVERDEIKFAKVREGATIPSKRDGDGCYDVYALVDGDFTIPPHTNELIPTGICSTFSSAYRIGVRERGSNTKSNAIVMAGQIDSNYTGEWFISIYNGNNIPLIYTFDEDKLNGEYMAEKYVDARKAIAQFAVEFVPQVDVVEVPLEEIQSLVTERGDGCLGSSGK